jgi:predicted RNA-binding protein with RPS1 domain
MGEYIQVKVIAVDDQDRVKLSRKQAMRELSGGGNGAEKQTTEEPQRR